jgi:hypothetical protein
LEAAVSHKTGGKRIAVKTRSGAGYAISAHFFGFSKQFLTNRYSVGALNAVSPRNNSATCHSSLISLASIGALKNTTLTKTIDAPTPFDLRSDWCVSNTDINKSGSNKAASRNLRAEGPTSEARTC